MTINIDDLRKALSEYEETLDDICYRGLESVFEAQLEINKRVLEILTEVIAEIEEIKKCHQ